MRILNRPMFRYGGPIKEGVMHGMRNNYQSGQLVKPGPGRPGYGGAWDPRQWGLKKAGIYAASKIPSFSKGWAKRVYNKMKPTSVPKYKNVYQMPGGQLTEAQIAAGMGRAKIPFASRAKAWVKENPYWAYGGTGVGMTSGAIPETVGAVAKGGYNLGKKGILQAADLLVHDKLFDQDKWFKERAEKKALEEGELSAEQIEINRLKKLLEGKKIDKVIDPDAAAKLAKTQQNERLKKYLDMMGYDSAKKGAISDALIDASALVQDASTEAGSLKEADWGKLINKAIQTTSKRLDKPAQIREAVGLMSVKAAIEKDLEDPQVKKLRALKIEESEKGLDPSPADLALAASGKTGKVTQDMLENIVRSTEGVENFKASFKNKKGTAYYDWLDDNQNASEMKFMKDVVSQESDFGAGFYVFPDRVVEVKDDLTMSWWH